jgi:signal transduction histidine kinase
VEISKEYGKLLQIGLIAIISVAIIISVVYYFFDKRERKLIQERKEICVKYASDITHQVEQDEQIHKQLSEFLERNQIYMSSSQRMEDSLTRIIKSNIAGIHGLEGGFYILGLNDFIGYAYPTSKPPVPVYGPPPRSYNIIRDQAIESIETGNPIINIHAFDPAIFPLATHPIRYDNQVVGSVWIRIHIERDLPVTKLKRVLNFLTIISLVGFMVMAMISFFLRSGIKKIRNELENTRKDPGYRLKHREGLFGFIPRSINGMLDLIEHEYKQKQKLERKLQQKEKLASLGKMIAGVAHEVKTPLSVIKTRIQMLQKDMANSTPLPEEADEDSIAIVIKEINRISDLVKRLLVFSRPIYENLRPTCIDLIIEEVISMMDFGRSGKRIKVIKKLQKDPPLVNADSNSLKQVFINLYSNSIEAIEESGTITTWTTYDTKSSVMTIKISDNGPGIPDDKLEKIFDPFFTTKETGTGLGLTISHEIITSHGGNISFQRNDDNMTICIVSLPLIN